VWPHRQKATIQKAKEKKKSKKKKSKNKNPQKVPPAANTSHISL
jgi:hypothetical protein